MRRARRPGLSLARWMLVAGLLLAGQAVFANQALNVSIAIFDPGVPDDQSVHRDLKIFPRIRAIEAMILPFVLRESLAGTGEWDAVRVVPKADDAAELSILAEIVRSDGATLEVRVRAVDAGGQVWLDKAISGAAGDAALFDGVADDLRLARIERSGQELLRIKEISLLRYGSVLAPSAFGEYFELAEDGTVELHRLPAQSDPMVDRIRRIRETEYVITDAIDAKFQELHADIADVYDLWRKYRQETVAFEASDAERAASTANSAPRGSYEALLNQYENYKYHRITQQEQDRLAVAFGNEVGPTIAAMEARVLELNAWIANKYSEWYRLLEELFEAETAAG